MTCPPPLPCSSSRSTAASGDMLRPTLTSAIPDLAWIHAQGCPLPCSVTSFATQFCVCARGL